MADTVQKKKEYYSSLRAIPALKGDSDYEEWYRRILQQLKLQDLLLFIQGTAIEPTVEMDKYKE
jgi:hypothetical protein